MLRQDGYRSNYSTSRVEALLPDCGSVHRHRPADACHLVSIVRHAYLDSAGAGAVGRRERVGEGVCLSGTHLSCARHAQCLRAGFTDARPGNRVLDVQR